MKLYTTPISPNCRQVEAVILHLELEVELIRLDLQASDARNLTARALDIFC